MTTTSITATSTVANNKQVVPVHKVLVNSESYKRKRATNSTLYSNCEIQFAVMERAKKVQASLAPEFPILIKYMLPSHISGGFCLNIPKQFSNANLPKEDTTIILEDEDGNLYNTKYLPRKSGLSGGWRRFAEDHKLLDADAAVFQLVKPTKFKVHIVRARDLEEARGALDYLQLDDSMKQMNTFNDVIGMKNLRIASKEKEDQNFQPFLTCKPEENTQKSSLTCSTLVGPISESDQSEVDFGYDICDGIRFSESALDFKEVKSFEDFDILVNGLVINSEISKHMQLKYYELCCSQKSFLHDHLIDGLNCKLVAGIIAETVNIADAIRASKISSCEDNFATWERTLKAFGGLGMNVSFLLARMTQLMILATKSKKNKEAKLGRVKTDAKDQSLQTQLLEVKETVSRLDTEIESLKKDAENLELMFLKGAKAPW